MATDPIICKHDVRSLIAMKTVSLQNDLPVCNSNVWSFERSVWL